jgi:hypothetical protein
MYGGTVRAPTVADDVHMLAVLVLQILTGEGGEGGGNGSGDGAPGRVSAAAVALLPPPLALILPPLLCPPPATRPRRRAKKSTLSAWDPEALPALAAAIECASVMDWRCVLRFAAFEMYFFLCATFFYFNKSTIGCSPPAHRATRFRRRSPHPSPPCGGCSGARSSRSGHAPPTAGGRHTWSQPRPAVVARGA